jgi:hypothetical protein
VGERAGQIARPALDTGAIDPEDAPDAAAAREDIEQTRAEMSETIDAIQERIAPEGLTEHAKDTAQEVAEHVIQQAKTAAQEFAERAIPQAKESAQEVAEHVIQQAKDAVSEMAEQTRAAVRAATIGKVEDMARNASDTASGWRHTLVATIKANPVPAALTGIGLGWLYMHRVTTGSSGARLQGHAPAGYRPGGSTSYGIYGPGGTYAPGGRETSGSGGSMRAMMGRAQETAGRVAGETQQRVGEAVDQVQESAGQVMGQVQETTGEVADQVQETAGQMVDQVQEQASRARGFLERQLDENPLAVGVAGVAVGAVLGMMVGPTPREDRLLGQTRDRLMGRAQEVTHDTLQKVEHVVDEVQSTAKKEAQEQSLIPQAAG